MFDRSVIYKSFSIAIKNFTVILVTSCSFKHIHVKINIYNIMSPKKLYAFILFYVEHVIAKSLDISI